MFRLPRGAGISVMVGKIRASVVDHAGVRH